MTTTRKSQLQCLLRRLRRLVVEDGVDHGRIGLVIDCVKHRLGVDGPGVNRSLDRWVETMWV